MIVRRTSFFLGAFLLAAAPFLLYKIAWLAGSAKAHGTMAFAGKSITGQVEHRYAVIYFMVSKDTVWFNGFDNILFPEGATIPIRYQRNNPSNARIDNFRSMWGDTLIYGGIPFIILLMLFVHPGIIPYKSRLQLTKKKPYIIQV